MILGGCGHIDVFPGLAMVLGFTTTLGAIVGVHLEIQDFNQESNVSDNNLEKPKQQIKR